MSPVYVYFTFLFICGTLRWHSRGAFWTAVSAITAYTMMSVYVAFVLELPTPEWGTFANRSVHLAAVAGLIGCMAAYQRRYQNEISRLVAWPRKIPPEAHALVAEVLAESAEILNAHRGSSGLGRARVKAISIWPRNRVRRSSGPTSPRRPTDPVVIPGLEGKNFQANDATDDRGTVVHWSGGSYRQRRGRPINAALQRRFEMRAVQSWSLDGELVRGRLFCLDKSNMRLDDLPFGVLVARMAVSRLDGLYLLKHLRDASAIEERLRLARDLHDSLLQTVAGSALQLLAARRQLDRDSASARKRLEDVQSQLGAGRARDADVYQPSPAVEPFKRSGRRPHVPARGAVQPGRAAVGNQGEAPGPRGGRRLAGYARQRGLSDRPGRGFERGSSCRRVGDWRRRGSGRGWAPARDRRRRSRVPVSVGRTISMR